MHPRESEALGRIAKALRFYCAFAAFLFCGFIHAATPPSALWIRDLDDPGLIPFFSDPRLFVSPGPAGSVYFATDVGLTVGRFDGEGNLLFKTKLLTNGTAFILARTTDPAGNLILGGYFNGRLGETYGINAPLLLKLSPEGAVLWSRSATNGTGGVAIPGIQTVAADATGNIYAGGYFTGGIDFGVTNFVTIQGDSDPFLAKYSPEGDLLWVQAGAAKYDSFSSLSVDAAGDLWASTSRLEPTPQFPQTWTGTIQKLTLDGSLIFEKPQTSPMILLANGTLEPFIWNSFSRVYPGPPAEYSADPQLGRLRSDGDIRWFNESFGGHGFGHFFDPAQDSQLSTYFVGIGGSNPSVAGVSFPGASLAIIKLDLAGQTQWGKPAYNFDSLPTIAVINPSTFYFGGAFQASSSVMPVRIDHFVLVRTNRSLYVAKLGPLSQTSKPLLTLPPQDLELIEGRKGYIVAGAASVAQPQYQWFFNNAELAGQTNTYIALEPVDRSHAGDYKIRISNNNGAVTSSSIRLTVRIPPSIVEQPIAQTVSAGQHVVLGVSVAGEPPLHFEWRLNNGSPLQGQTNATIQFTNVTFLQQGEYHVTVSNPYGTITSAKAYLTVLSPPILRGSNPSERTVIAGSDLTLFASIVGSPPLQFQWYENGLPIYGATASSLLLPKNNSAGPFKVVASNPFGSYTNDQISLRLQYPLAIVATNQTNNFRYVALGKADTNGFFALRGPAADTAGSVSYLERFDLSLKRIWTNPVAVTGTLAFARDIAVDPQTNIYVLGDFKGDLTLSQLTPGYSALHPALFLGRVAANGHPEWLTPFGPSGTNRAGKVRFFNGSVWTANSTLAAARPDPELPEVTFTNLHIAQFDPGGSLLSSNTISSFPKRASWTNPPSGILLGDFAIDADTNLLIGGTVKEFVNDRAPFEIPALIKYDSAGQPIWSRLIEVTNRFGRFERFGRVTGVKIGPANDIYVVGFFGASGAAAFLARFAPQGEQRWIQYLSPYFPGDPGPAFQSIDILPNGNLVVGGLAASRFVVGIDPFLGSADSYGQGAFAFEYSTDGKLITPTIFGQANSSILALLTLDDQIVAAGFATFPTRGQLHLLGAITPRITNAFRHYVMAPQAVVSVRPQVIASGPVSFQWLFNETPISGQTNAFLNLDSAGATPAGVYQLIVQNSLSVVTNQPIFVSRYNVEYANSRPRLILDLPETKSYRLDHRDDLTSETYWVPGQAFTGNAGPIIVEDPEIPARRFFRLVPL
jgi:hypothetical protein